MQKDYEEYVYIARAYMNANKPDKSALATLELAKERNAMEPQVLLAMEMHFMEIKSKFSIFSLP
jgi:hypothetical protein